MTIKQGFIFPWNFRLFGILLIISAVVSIPLNIWFFPPLIFIGSMLLLARSGIEFDKNQNTYRPFNAFLSFRFGDKLILKTVDKIFINHNMAKSTTYTAHTAKAYTSKDSVFDAYLKFADGEKIHIKSNKAKNIIMKEMQELAKYLETDLIDNSSVN